MRSRKSSLVESSSNYFGANQIVNVGSQQARWLMSGSEPAQTGFNGIDGFGGRDRDRDRDQDRDREALHQSLGQFYLIVFDDHKLETPRRLCRMDWISY
jgi:hypothetical protein